MKHIFLFAIVISFLSCSTKSSDSKPIISVSIVPQKYFIERIAGELCNVNVMVKPGASPATYDPLPSQMKNISNSVAYFKIGHIGFEHAWMKSMIDVSKEMQVFDLSKGVDLIAEEEQVHGDHVHLHGIDPHIWMSYTNGKIIANNTYNALCKLFPTKQSAFKIELDKLISDIDKADKAYKQMLSTCSKRTFIIFHPALTYSARDYNFTQVSIELHGKNPSLSHITNIIKQAKIDEVNTVFIQTEFDIDNASIVAKEIGAEVIQINPLSESWLTEMASIHDILYNQLK